MSRRFISLTIALFFGACFLAWFYLRQDSLAGTGRKDSATLADAEKTKPTATDKPDASVASKTVESIGATAKTAEPDVGKIKPTTAGNTPLRLSTSLALAGLKKGQEIILPLSDGGSLTGRINLVQFSSDGTVRLGGTLIGGRTGSFSIGQGKEGLQGRVLLPREGRAYLISAMSSGQILAQAMSISQVVCYLMPRAADFEPQPALPGVGPQGAPPELRSRPGAAAVLYLDFDGAVVTDPDWNDGNTITAAASTLSDSQIMQVWDQVKEDYLPFNINVTTVESDYTSAAPGRRMRVIITPTKSWYGVAGGVAYVDSFARGTGSYFNADVPSWVFNPTVDTIANAISHEMGHTLGLSHDGRNSPAEEYYEGHGSGAVSWGPIMGAAYGISLTQWSKGEYASANNQEDDVAIISGGQATPLTSAVNQTGYVTDDAGNTRGVAAALAIAGSNVSQTGLISSAADADFYSFSVGSAADFSVSASLASPAPNLDIALELQDAGGNVLGSAAPDLSPTATLNVSLGAGTYYLKVTGSGRGSVSGDGYSNYGSLGHYSLSGTISAVVTGPPTITTHPANQTANSGGSATFSVSAIGNPAPTYQWQKNGVDVGGATGSSYTLSNVSAGDAGSYRVVVSNSFGSVTSNPATLTVNAAPVITTHPASQTIVEGAPVTFSAAASGTPAPTFQWQKAGVNIAGATGSSYTIASVTPASAGAYRVIATNPLGTATSNVATLTVAPPGPLVTNLSPTRQVFTPGQSLNLSVTATGAGAITYQWIHNGRVIPGATGPSLSIGNLQRSDGGWYVVLLTDSNGTVRSAPIFVTIGPAQTQVRAWGTNTDGVQAIPTGLTTATAVSAGGTFALALKSDGTVVSWGSNTQGQGLVPAGLTEVVAVSAGHIYALGLKSDGTVINWGGTGFGGMLNPPDGLSGVVAIKAAGAHALALKSDGTVVGWGQNISGETLPPAGLTGVVAITAGFEFSVALKSDGTVVAWGDNFQGKTTVPAGLSGVVAIAAGDAGHVLALKSDGTVVAWGRSNEGQTDVPAGLNHVVMIAAGERHSMALKDDGTVVLWGNLTTVPPDLTGVLAISGGSGFAMALCDGTFDVAPTITTQPASTVGVETATASLSVAAAGTAPLSYQWRKGGGNIPGATSSTLTLSDLAIGDAGNYDVVVSNYLGSVTSTVATLTVNAIPIVTNLSPGMQAIQPGQSLNLSVTATGTGTLSYQWTHNGQPIAGATSSSLTIPSVTAQATGWYLVFITDSHGTRRSLPIRVLVAPAATQVRAWSSNSFWVNAVPADLTGVLTVAAGPGNGMALRQDRTVVVWGGNSSGQINVPAGLSGVGAIAAGNGYCLAVKGDGTVVGWGANNYGAQLVPAGLTGVVDVSAGDSHAVALKSNGRVVAWGSNNYGQTSIPGGLKDVFALSAGGFHTLAIKDDGTVVAWGENGSGQRQVPAGLNNVVAVAAGYAHSLALKSDGTVVAWGSNSNGETTVPAGLNGVIAVAAARYHSLALKADGTVIAWGSALDGSSAVPGNLAGVYAIADGTGFSLALRDVTGESAPTITTQPASQSLAQGQRVSFTVVANGPGTLAYQWRKNGVNIAGATSAFFIIAESVNADAGNYDVVVSNYIGSTTSTIAVLTVNPPAVITNLSPTRQVLSPGQSLNLSVTATGVGALSYQWTRNGRPIIGATGSTYAVPGVTFADAGWYLVYITDSNGTKRSAPIFVTVAPVITEVKAWGSNGYHELDMPAGLNNANVIAVAAGSVTALALKRDGTVVAWGDDWNHAGNTTVPAGLTDVVAIAAGPFHSIALKSDGTVVNWGWYSSGRNPPPAGLTNVVAIAANYLHSMALKSDGTVVIWGGTETGVPAGLTDVISIAAPGHDSSLALKADGTIAYWDSNLGGQNSVPAAFTDAVAISAAQDFALALKSNGTVVGWALSPYASMATTIPAGLSNVIAVDAGGYHSLALKSDGTISGWGENSSGQILIPAGLDNVLAISAGTWFSLALRDGSADSAPVIVSQPVGQTKAETGQATFTVTATGPGILAYQWFKNGNPISGATSATLNLQNLSLADAGNYHVIVSNHIGSVSSESATLIVNAIPVVTNISPVRQVLAPAQPTSLSVSATGAGPLSYQWFRNNRLLNGATASSLNLPSTSYQDDGAYVVQVTDDFGTRYSAPMFVIVAPTETQVIGWGEEAAGSSIPPVGLNNAIAIATGGRRSYALKPDGRIFSWGQGTDAPANLVEVVAVAATEHGGIALKSNGTVTTWSGFFGDADIPPPGLDNVVSIAAGAGHYLALRSNGKVVVWGNNAHGETNMPQGLADVVTIAAGPFVSMAIKSDGTMVAWGDNGNGQTNVPQGLSDVTGATANSNNAFALKSDGTIVTWGNYYSQPQVPSGLTSVIALSGGLSHTVALKQEGSVVAWGINNYGAATVPVGLTRVIRISAYWHHALVLRDITPILLPTITMNPVSQLAQIGANASFSILAEGTNIIYQWQRLPGGSGSWIDLGNGGAYSGATTTTLAIAGVTHAMLGDQFRCVISNVLGSATSNTATLTVTVPLPVITTQPVGQAVAVGSPVDLSVTASSPVAFTYQWRKNGTNIGGATSSTYTINSAQLADGADYTVVVTNSAGSVTSQAATVYVSLPPVITTHPVTQAVYAGTPANFSVVATSNAPLTYAWWKNGSPIGGATSATYAIANAQSTDAADYSVVVTNVAGSVTSNAATLTVNGTAAPVITQQPTSQTVLEGAPVHFTVAATGTPAPAYQWQVLRFGDNTWNNTGDGADYSGSNAATFSILVSDMIDNGDQYRCVVSNVAGTATSNPVTVTVLAAGFTKLAVGRYHSLRLGATAALSASGTNTQGQLGNGTTVASNSPMPVQIPGQTVVDVSAGSQHSLLLTAAGQLWTTGFNGTGQLGDGTTAARSTPVSIATGVAGIAGGFFHSAFLKSDGTLWTVGGNDSGQLGDGTTTNRLTPVQVASNVVNLAAGTRQTFFIKSDGTLWGMGDMNGSGVPVSTPVQIATNVTSVAAGGYHSLFIKADGTLWGLGYNLYGALGTGNTTDVLAPVQITTGVKAVAVGYYHSFFIKTDGALWAMGYNSAGQLGDGSTTNRSSPVPITTNVVAASASENSTLFTKADGTLWGMGFNGGQFGNGGTASSSTPVQIATGVIPIPAASAGLAASTVASLDRVHLAWQPAANAVTYEVWRNTVNNSATATQLVSQVRLPVYQDLTATGPTVYYYWIKAVNPAGTGGFSDPAAGSATASSLIAPTITTQPQGQTVNVGADVTFTVVASGTAPLTYQWRKDAVGLSGATSASLVLPGVTVAAAGSYDVMVSNAGGSVTSNPAVLTVDKLAQTITFAVLADRSFTATPVGLSATASSGLTVGFAVQSGPATLSGNDLTLTGPGTVTVRASQAGNGTYAAATPVDRSFVVTALPAFTTWRQSKFTAGELLDATISGPNADPDADGLANLLEYALGLEPMSATTADLPQAGTLGSDWTYTYTRPADRTELTYVVEYSTDLATWGTGGVTHELISSSGATETWRARYPLAGAANCYFRLKIVVP